MQYIALGVNPLPKGDRVMQLSSVRSPVFSLPTGASPSASLAVWLSTAAIAALRGGARAPYLPEKCHADE